MRQVLVPLTLLPTLPPAGSTVQELRGHSMGTTWSVKLAAPALPAGLAGILQQALDSVVAQMSHWTDDSDLMRFNHGAPGSWHSLPDHFFEVVQYAMWVAHVSGGAYDPFAGSLVNRWGFGARERHDQAGFTAPSASQIATLLQRGQPQLDVAGRRLLQPGGVQLDLSSIAKGFAVDLLGRRLAELDLPHHLVEVGGELRGAGVKPDGQPWWVELEAVPDPAAPQQSDCSTTALALHGIAVATSGDYRRHYQHDGQTASHTIDPRTGYPIRHGLASVSVVHPSCMAADAWSTALTVLGPVAGLRLATRQKLAARFIVRAAGLKPPPGEGLIPEASPAPEKGRIADRERPTDGALEITHSPAWMELLQ